MVPLGYMAQHVWEVGAAVLAATFVLQGLVFLIKGSDAPQAAGWNPRIVRLWGGVGLLLGVGVGLAAFLVEAEQPGTHNGDHWGGAWGLAILIVWVALTLTFSALPYIRAKPPKG